MPYQSRRHQTLFSLFKSYLLSKSYDQEDLAHRHGLHDRCDAIEYLVHHLDERVGALHGVKCPCVQHVEGAFLVNEDSVHPRVTDQGGHYDGVVS